MASARCGFIYGVGGARKFCVPPRSEPAYPESHHHSVWSDITRQSRWFSFLRSVSLLSWDRSVRPELELTIAHVLCHTDLAHSLCYRGSLTPWGPLPTEASRHSLHIALVSHLSPIFYLRTRLSQFLEYLLGTIPTVSKLLCLQCGDQVQYAAVETRYCSDVWVDISGD